MERFHNKIADMIQNYLWRREPDFAKHDLLKTADLLDEYAALMRAHAAGDAEAATRLSEKTHGMCMAFDESFAALQDGAIL